MDISKHAGRSLIESRGAGTERENKMTPVTCTYEGSAWDGDPLPPCSGLFQPGLSPPLSDACFFFIFPPHPVFHFLVSISHVSPTDVTGVIDR